MGTPDMGITRYIKVASVSMHPIKMDAWRASRLCPITETRRLKGSVNSANTNIQAGEPIPPHAYGDPV